MKVRILHKTKDGDCTHSMSDILSSSSILMWVGKSTENEKHVFYMKF